MKITELKHVPKNKIGFLNRNDVKLEPHEEATAKFLTLYGFNIEVIKPINTPKSNNPDFLVNGTIWETKSPITSNLKTLKKRLHEASQQSTHIIIDLRRIKHNYSKVESEIIKRFNTKNTLRVMILITTDGIVIEYRK